MSVKLLVRRIYVDGITFNSLNKCYGMHYQVRAKYMREVKEKAFQLWKAQMTFAMLTPVTIEFQPVIPSGKLFDADNYVAITKPILDGAIVAGLIPDDGPKYVSRVILNAGRRPTVAEHELVKQSVLIAELRENA